MVISIKGEKITFNKGFMRIFIAVKTPVSIKRFSMFWVIENPGTNWAAAMSAIRLTKK